MFSKKIKFIYICMCLQLSSCTNLVHQPSKIQHYDVNKVSPVKAQEVQIKNNFNHTLSALFFDSNTINTHSKSSKKVDQKKILVQFHGNSENISSHFFNQVWLIQHGFDFFTFDYSGYGQSEGVAHFPQVLKDGAYALEYVLETYPDHDIYIWAESLGGMIAQKSVHFLSKQKQDKIKAMIIEGSFRSLKKTASFILKQNKFEKLISWLPHLVVSDKYAPKKNNATFDAPTLVMHSQKDPKVPFTEGQNLYKHLKTKQKCNLWIEEQTHIGTGHIANRKYRKHIIQFLQKGCNKK